MAGTGRTQAVTILFCDLVASTERRARLGDDAFDGFTARFMASLRRAISEHHGREVSSAGDGLMVVFPESVADAVDCATAMHRTVAVLDPDDPPRIRVGISCGEVAQDGTEYSGMPIVEAARLEAAATPGKTYASGVVRSLIGSRRGIRFREVGPLTLKGLPKPLVTVEVIDEAPSPVPSPRASAEAVGGRRPPAPRRRWLVVAGAAAVVAIVVVTLVVVAGGGSDDTASGAGVEPAKGYSPRWVKGDCDREFLSQVPDGQCGVVVVPEDRAKPAGRQLRLRVTRAPAREGDGTGEPVVAFGAVGGPGIEDPAKTPARDHADLITLQTRLSDASNPAMACPEFEPIGRELLGRPERDPATIARGQAALRACHTRLSADGVALERYTVDDAAEDVLDLLRALQLQRVDLSTNADAAVSAYTVIRRAPGAVRTLTLDAPAAPGTSTYSDPTAQLASAVDHYVELCGRDAECARAYPDLPARGRANWQRYQAAPALVSVPPPLMPDARVSVLLDGDRLAKALADSLGDTRTEGAIAAGIATTPPDLVASIAADYDYYFTQPDYPWASVLSNLCSYAQYTVSKASRISVDARPDLAGVDDGVLQWQCAAWPVPKVSESAFASFASDVPTMLIDGALNPFSSRDWLSRLEGGLPNSTTLLFGTLGSRALLWGPPCLNELRRAFLADPSARLDARACVRRSPPIEFVTS